MEYKFSKTTGVFYPGDIEYRDIPDDAISVTQEEFAAAMNREPGATLDVIDGKLVIIPAPQPTPEELQAIKTAENTQLKASLIAQATQQINLLQDAVDLDMATDDEKAALTAWKKYRVLLNRVDVSSDVVWPQKPGEGNDHAA